MTGQYLSRHRCGFSPPTDVIDHEHWKMFENVVMSKPANHVIGGNPKLPAAVRNSWRGVELHKKLTDKESGYQQFVRERAAMGYSIDVQVGRLVKKLKTMGVLDNTVIIYTSDSLYGKPLRQRQHQTVIGESEG